MITRQKVAIVIAASLMILSFGLRGWAQAGGTVSGTVKDSSGAVIPGVTATLTNTALGTSFTSVSDNRLMQVDAKLMF